MERKCQKKIVRVFDNFIGIASTTISPQTQLNNFLLNLSYNSSNFLISGDDKAIHWVNIYWISYSVSTKGYEGTRKILYP